MKSSKQPNSPRPETPARISLLSMRGMDPVRSRCLRFEFEDIVKCVDGIELVTPPAPAIRSRRFRRLALAAGMVRQRFPGSLGSMQASGTCHREAVIVTIESLSDLESLPPASRLRQRAHTAVCYIDELFTKGFRQRTGEIRLLRQFDRIFLGCAGSVEEVADVTGRPCSYLAPSVDALALCPYPETPVRAIDVYWMGRRAQGMHQALVEMAENRGWWYLFDTTSGRHTAPDHRAHRRQLSEFMRRARYFVVTAGKSTLPEETGGQEEVGFRYFEGAAAGAVLIGQRPHTAAFERVFGWPDSVIEIPLSSRDLEHHLQPLEEDPARTEAIRRRNVAQALRRHDHVYRWSELLTTLGLPLTPAIEERVRLLRARADSVLDTKSDFAGQKTAFRQ